MPLKFTICALVSACIATPAAALWTLCDEACVPVLLTGFLPFLNFTNNPTQAVAMALDQTCVAVPSDHVPCVRVHAHVLPVNRTGAMWTSEHLASLGQPTPYAGVFHMGYESTTKLLKLETIASNNRANDTGGPSTAPAIAGAPGLLPVTLPMGQLVDQPVLRSLTATHLPVDPAVNSSLWHELWSRDAGDYYCNEVLYRTLHAIRNASMAAPLAPAAALLPAMFVHFPPSQVLNTTQGAHLMGHVMQQALMAAYSDRHGRRRHEGGHDGGRLSVPWTVALSFAGGLLAGVGVLMLGQYLSARRHRAAHALNPAQEQQRNRALGWDLLNE